MKRILLVVAHGTVEDEADLPAFVSEIRHGRPAKQSFLDELLMRYQTVGGSPLLRETQKQAKALGEATGLETRVAMRLWEPRVVDVLSDLGEGDEVILVPLAPFSVDIYEKAAFLDLQKANNGLSLRSVNSWGEKPSLISAYVEDLLSAVSSANTGKTHVLLTAHSLPRMVIERGDPYAKLFETTASLVAREFCGSVEAEGLPRPVVKVCYQSQGAMDGAWLGPDLKSAIKEAHAEGATRVVVSPIGFLTEHIETLFDLDIEARKQTEELGLEFVRVRAIGSHPGLIEALKEAVLEEISS